MPFLPTTRAEMEQMGCTQLDFVYVSGDAYVDHSSFGMAIITRVLQAFGYSVGVIAQPDWNDPESVATFGEPRLAFLVSSGNMDSMVNHYTSNKKHRSKDAYSPGGEMGKRPDRAVTVYGNLIRKRFKDSPIILGGIEASLRRLAHYDYWQDALKRSVLLDSTADLLIYGMGERSIHQIADALDAGLSVQDLCFIPGTVFKAKDTHMTADDAIELPGFSALRKDPKEYARSFAEQMRNMDSITAHTLIEPYPDDNLFVIQNPPADPLTTDELDFVYELPYMGTYHPSYKHAGGVPAIKEVRFSLTSNRGCFGGCSFCALAFHQGRRVQARSTESLIREATALTKLPDFKGYIHDVGGPTANFDHPSCDKQLKAGVCPNKQCLFPKPCAQLNVDESRYTDLLRKLRKIEGVKKVFVRSGIRFDYVMADASGSFMDELVEHHISGQLRVAPEHVSDKVLSLMGKPANDVYKAFCKAFEAVNERTGKKQFIVPYLMSSHPGSTLDDAVMLAEAVRDMGYMPEQVSDFYPTPSTASTVMYFTGIDPRTMEHVYVPKQHEERAMQRALIQYRAPQNHDLIVRALKKAGREDLIGWDDTCLVRPRKKKADTHKRDSDGGKKPARKKKSATGSALRKQQPNTGKKRRHS